MWTLAICVAVSAAIWACIMRAARWLQAAMFAGNCPVCSGDSKISGWSPSLLKVVPPEEQSKDCVFCEGTGTWASFISWAENTRE